MDSSRREFKVKLPLRIRSSKKKLTALNLNVYRNLHHRSAHAQKINFAEIAKKLLKDIPALGRITLHYEIFVQTKRRLDIMNVGSIVDKYFSDCLTDYGVIEDDDNTHLDFVSFGFGGLVEEEYILVTITEIEPRKGNDMRILLDQADIQNALDAFVMEQGITGATGVELTVDGDGQITAEVKIGDTAVATPAKKSRGGRPAGSKNKPKEPKPDVSTTAEDSTAGDGAGTTDTTEAETPDTSGTDDDKPVVTEEPKAKGGGKGKNLFTESQEESSTGTDGDSEQTEEDGDETPVKAAKKSSIFDT